MSDPNEPVPAASLDGPPPAERAAPEPAADPRAELLRLAGELTRHRSGRLLAEYLRLRRAAMRAC